MSYPVYILQEESNGVVEIKPIYFNTEEEAKYISEAFKKMNEIMWNKGYEVEVKTQ